MNIKQVESREELEKNWKNCFIKSLPRVKTRKVLLEGFDVGIAVWKKCESK